MDEIQNFIKVWIKATLCLCYCYYISSRIPKGIFRLLSLIPIFYIFLLLPLNLHSIHLCGLTTFFLVWLCAFKLLLFAFDQGPLSPLPPNVIHFIFISSLPIKLTPKHNPSKSFTKKRFFPKALLLKVLFWALIICAYDYAENLNPRLILLLYCCHLYLGLELVLTLCATPARAAFGFELEPQFDEPYLSSSLQDFWGRRWNLMVTSILRPTVYDPLRRISTRLLGPAYGSQPAVMATFVVSGLMHELIYYYLARAPPTWEVTWFFVLHGVCTAAEVAAKKALKRRGWRLHRAVSVPLTVAFLAVTGDWLFFPQLVRNGVVKKGKEESAMVMNFVESKLRRFL